MSSWAIEYFGDEIITKDGLKKTTDVLAGKKYVGIYFSAHWCPPCRAFTPTLSEFYEELQQEDPNCLEIIFASSDSDQSSYDNYYGEMPWKGIPFNKASTKEELSSRFEVRGIPTFIILSVADGSVKDPDGRTTVAAAKGNISKVLSQWN